MAYSDEYNVRSFDGDISTGANSDADIGLCQSRRIINTITNHSNYTTTLLQLTHLGHLVRWQHFGKHHWDSNLQCPVINEPCKTLCHLLNDCLRFWHEISHIHCLFIYTYIQQPSGLWVWVSLFTATSFLEHWVTFFSLLLTKFP